MESESQLVEKARAGDGDALRLLLERYSGQLRRHIGGWMPAAVRRKVSVSDVLQETNLAAFQGLGGFEERGEGSLRNWLLRIAEHKAKTAVRRHAGAAKRALDREVSRGRRPDTEAHAGNAPSPSEAAIGAETEGLVRQAMEKLPPSYREVLRLAVEEKLDLREIAQRTGRSYEAAKKAYGRALSRFTSIFESLTGERRA